MRRPNLFCLLLACGRLGAQALQIYDITDEDKQQPIVHDDASAAASTHTHGVSTSLFSDLERLSRLVDIAYCVGVTGISRPFSCVSRCKDFPSLELIETWNTGPLMTDSCGYIAVDHGGPWRPEARKWKNTLKTDDDIEAEGEKGAIVVAFRGTYSITNTVIDLSTVPQEYVPYPNPDDGEVYDGGGSVRPEEKCTNCTVHMGFLASWRSARELILPVLMATKTQHPGKPVRLVGHSLGGAVAALAALELRLVLGWDDVTVTTFGEPRVGNKGLAAFIDHVFDMEGEAEKGRDDEGLEKRMYRRVTHAQDPVPLLPLSEWSYRSHAGEIFIEKVALAPAPADLRLCRGDRDPHCSDAREGNDGNGEMAAQLRELLLSRGDEAAEILEEAGWADDDDVDPQSFPLRLKLWQLFFAHRDYFWRLGLCVPGGDPADWGRDKYRFPNPSRPDEL